MRKYLAATKKDLLLLLRDKTGLLLLFLMPSVLVIVITLVQENVLELSGQHQTELLLNDEDHGPFAEALRKALLAEQIQLIDYPADAKNDKKMEMKDLVSAGHYQASLTITAGTSLRVQQEMTKRFATTNADAASGKKPAAVASLELILDPAALAGYRVAMTGRLQLAARTAEIELMARLLEKRLKDFGETNPLLDQIQPLHQAAAVQQNEVPYRGMALIVEKDAAGKGNAMQELFNPVNRNVPAWALFGMFFTAIPIAGGILAERRSGLGIRINTMPVSPFILMLGRVTAYLLVCSCQFFFIMLIGIYLFPHLGLQAFSLPANPLVLAPAILASSLAACGLGVFLGSVGRSYEQASALGATLVVSAAAMGGVMVPIYAMPHVMQKLSVLSPFSWGLDAYLGLLLRGQSLTDIYPDLARLLIFAALAMVLARTMRHT